MNSRVALDRVWVAVDAGRARLWVVLEEGVTECVALFSSTDVRVEGVGG